MFDDPPPELAGATRATDEWRRLAPILRRARQVCDADRAALIAVCLAWGQYLDAIGKTEPAVVRTPSGYPMVNPYISIANKALFACLRLWEQLGLTPASRSRVSAVGLPAEADPFTEFDQPLDDRD